MIIYSYTYGMEIMEGPEQSTVSPSTQRHLAKNTSLVETERPGLMNMYLSLSDRLLRNQPLTKRAKIAYDLYNHTTHYNFFDGKMREHSSGAMVNDILGARIKVHDTYDTEIVYHEGLHYLQDILKVVPRNNALTYTVGTVADCMDNPRKFKGDEYAYLRDEYTTLTREQYLQGVLAGNAFEYFRGGWMLDPEELKNRSEGDRMNKHILDYLENESLYDSEFETGEVDSTGKVKDAYTPMSNIGIQRGIRAAAMGHFTGNIENAWAVVWLHSQGVPFAEAERIVAMKYLDGTLGDVAIDKKANLNELDLYLQSEKMRKTQTLDALPAPVGKMAGLLASAKERLATYYRSKLLGEPLPEAILKRKYSIFDEAMADRRSRNAETGVHSVALLDLQNHIVHLMNEAKKSNSQAAANIYAFGDGMRKLSIHEVITKPERAIGKHIDPPLPSETASPLQERIGSLYLKPGQTGNIDISDIVSLMTDNTRLFTIIANGDRVHFLEKPQATMEALQQMGEKEQRKHIESTIQKILGSKEEDVVTRAVHDLGLRLYSMPAEFEHASATNLFILPEQGDEKKK